MGAERRKEGRKDARVDAVAGGGVGRKSSKAMWEVKGGHRESKALSAFLGEGARLKREGRERN